MIPGKKTIVKLLLKLPHERGEGDRQVIRAWMRQAGFNPSDTDLQARYTPSKLAAFGLIPKKNVAGYYRSYKNPEWFAARVRRAGSVKAVRRALGE